eukprot:1341453-Prorocentrum_lima.AAC.1
MSTAPSKNPQIAPARSVMVDRPWMGDPLSPAPSPCHTANTMPGHWGWYPDGDIDGPPNNN